ncbi:MAG: sigma-54-dependent Fis family transcriptional regulator, partial [Firmicutes bacterium]|nr:sigma-54-dependent Fis family transcriptional regulator [Bacillota bacterium]
MRNSILIIDDEKSICTFLALALEDEFDVYTANSAEQAFDILKSRKIHLAVLDLLLGDSNGLDVLQKMKSQYAEIAVIMMTAFGDIGTSVEAIKRGAFHYLCKPVNLDELIYYIHQAMEFQDLSRQVEDLSNALVELEQRTYYGEIIGKSEAMQRVYQMIDRVKDLDTSIVITGESGTGKELVARAIHRNGARKSENFVTVNCAAIPEGLLEEEFFGHVKGSFTGAVSDKKGKLELANRGTLFLDEVGDMPLALQGKLLRALQEKESMPIGGSEYRKIDVRVISATNRELLSMVKEGTFRQDLYYRLHVVEIHMPPLRERKQDIPQLCSSVITRLAGDMNRNIRGLTPDAERLLMKYHFPGNVRELINILEYACILCNGEYIDIMDLPDELRRDSSPNSDMSVNAEFTAAEAVQHYLSGMSIKDVEKLLIENALAANPQSK